MRLLNNTVLLKPIFCTKTFYSGAASFPWTWREETEEAEVIDFAGVCLKIGNYHIKKGDIVIYLKDLSMQLDNGNRIIKKSEIISVRKQRVIRNKTKSESLKKTEVPCSEVTCSNEKTIDILVTLALWTVAIIAVYLALRK